jgi:hypothetical protein
MPRNVSLETKEICSGKYFDPIVVQIYAPHLLTKTALRSAVYHGQRAPGPAAGGVGGIVVRPAATHGHE